MGAIVEEQVKAPEKGRAAIKDTALPLMESFYTLQGEGGHTGKAAWFIRLGGCDVGCHWCDVKESWNADQFAQMPVQTIVAEAKASPCRTAVVTGGEPLMHNLDLLCAELHAHGFKNHIETSGTSPLTGQWDWLCLSPKKFKAPRKEYFAAAHELKVVIYHESDLDWAASFLPELNAHCQLYLQPEWGRRERVMPAIVKYIKDNPQWQMSLQTHKYMDIP